MHDLHFRTRKILNNYSFQGIQCSAYISNDVVDTSDKTSFLKRVYIPTAFTVFPCNDTDNNDLNPITSL